MKNTIDNFVLTLSDTLRKAMLKLDSLEDKLCVVCGTNGQVVRTVTNGDVRRFLLSGGSMDDKLSALPEKKPISALYGTSDSDLLDIMVQNDINTIVLVDQRGTPLTLCNRASLTKKILLSPPHLGKNEMRYVQEAFDSNWIAPAGPNLTMFENKLAKTIAREHALAVSSGTAALHLALRVLGINAGDRVYVSDLTFVASLQPILYENATPVLIDSEPTGWNMSPMALERKLLKDEVTGDLPAAIIVAHIYGQVADMPAIMNLAERYKIPVIEDAAEGLGANIDGKPCGSHGILSAFSFNGNKMITTSGGGALASDCEELIERARNLSSQGRDLGEHYQHSAVAYNYRMSNVLAGIGLGQLDVLAARVKRRREIYEMYRDSLMEIGGFSFQLELVNTIGCRWLTVIQCDPDVIDLHPYQIMRRLSQLGIETRPAWKPMHMQPLCSTYEFEPHNEDNTVSSSLFLRSLCLPSGSVMLNADIERVVHSIKNVILRG
jgi:dTDP-4-amino-4,6-dideoxygalactose transaminase